MSESATLSRSVSNAAWAEVIQLLPIISLALPFIVTGSVDVSQAGWGFVLGAALTIPITTIVLIRGQLLNPILAGTALWLWLGAVAFQLDVEGLRSWLISTQAFGLFVASLLVGVVMTFTARHGFIACLGSSTDWTRRASLQLLAVNVAIVAWAWWFHEDIRLGGGLPFIALNVTRRVMMRRAPTP